MNQHSDPPSEIAGADTLEFAHIDSSVFRAADGPYMVTDGHKLGPVPALVIARNQHEADDFLLLFCDVHWGVLAASGHSTLPAAKDRAEREYPGVSRLWQFVAGA